MKLSKTMCEALNVIRRSRGRTMRRSAMYREGFTANTFDALRRRGLIEYAGFCEWGLTDLGRAAVAGWRAR